MKTIKLLVSLTIIAILAACASTGDKALTAQGLFEQHVEVSYGGKGASALQSMTQLGLFKMDEMGIEAGFTLKAMRPNYFSIDSEIMGMQMSMGCNSSSCWNIQPMQGSMNMEGETLDSFIQSNDLYQYEHMDKYYESMEIVENDNSEANEYKVKAVNKYGRENFYYFSKDTGLISAYTLTADSPMGVATQHTNVKSYGEFGGFKLPTEIEISSDMGSFNLITNSVSFEPLSQGDFASPE